MSIQINATQGANSVKNHFKQQELYGRLSSGNKINSAKDDAAGLAVMKVLETQIRGLDKGIQNTSDMQNLVKTAEGGLSSISDNLQRIRELGVQASNGTLSDTDRQAIQMEISQAVEGINETVENTQYNNMKLLDGTFQNANTASSANGIGAYVTISSISTDDLGITGLNVTDPNFIKKIDNAVEKVSESRADLGAKVNAFEFTNSSSAITALNTAAAKSRIGDTQVDKAMSDLNKQRILQEYSTYSSMQQMEDTKNLVSSGMLMGNI